MIGTPVMPERWRWAGVDLDTYARMVTQTSGTDTLPPLRGSDILVPSRVGRLYGSKVHDARRLALTLWVSDMDDTGSSVHPDARTGARANLDTLQGLFVTEKVGMLERLMPDGTTRTATAEVVTCEIGGNPVGLDGFPMVVDFSLPDPWFYGAVAPASITLNANPKAGSYDNPGTVPTHRIVFDITGPASNPRITNTTNGWYLEALVNVAAGTHLILDCWAATAENDNLNAIGSVRHSGGALWFRLEPGVNNLSVSGTSLGGDLTITATPPFA